jgi:rhamnosyltransferase
MSSDWRKISIIIPTLNAGVQTSELLSRISRQSLLPLEVIIADSESDDDTPLRARNSGMEGVAVRIITINRSSFRHGTTRNVAASHASGNILVFITQDALPADSEWLDKLTAPFAHGDVGCVFGRHLPHVGGNPLIAHDITAHFSTFGDESYCFQRVDWQSEHSVQTYRKNRNWYCFNSNVNSAVRKSVWETMPFRDVSYAEDQLFGKDLIEAGYTKVYARDAAVIHSHEYTLLSYFRRYFDEYRGLRMTLGSREGAGLVSFLPLVVASTLREWRYLLRADIDGKLYWCMYAPWYHLARRCGALLGGRYELFPPRIRKWLSLEGRA